MFVGGTCTSWHEDRCGVIFPLQEIGGPSMTPSNLPVPIRIIWYPYEAGLAQDVIITLCASRDLTRSTNHRHCTKACIERGNEGGYGAKTEQRKTKTYIGNTHDILTWNPPRAGGKFNQHMPLYIIVRRVKAAAHRARVIEPSSGRCKVYLWSLREGIWQSHRPSDVLDTFSAEQVQ